MPHHDLLIIGAGSGNTLIGPEHDKWNVAIAEPGPFGGTCMNRGCIPSKMLVHIADLALSARQAPKLGIETAFLGTNWDEIQDRIFGRIDHLAAEGLTYRENLPNVTVYRHNAQFINERTVELGSSCVSAEKIVLAAGARAVKPDIPGLAQTPYQTSDSIMRNKTLPKNLAIIGGGFIAVEMAHIFEALGTNVIMLIKGKNLLSKADRSIQTRITDLYKERLDLRTETEVTAVEYDKKFKLNLNNGTDIQVDELLIATGRKPNSDLLDVKQGGIDVDENGYVTTDNQLRTSATSTWALGDITNSAQLKHTANEEARIVAHNILNPENPISLSSPLTPYAVFGYPKIACVGLTEEELVSSKTPYSVSIREYSSTAYGWAMEDTTGFVKLIRDPKSHLLLGAHILGPEAPTLLQQLITSMAAGITTDDLAKNQLYIHPAMPEVVEQALLGF